TYDIVRQQGYLDFQETYTNEIIKQFNEVKQALEQKTKREFKELLEQYCHRSQSFLNEVSQRMESLLGIDFKLITDQFDLEVYTSFYFDYGKGEQIEYIFPGLIGKLFYQKMMQKRFLKRLYRH